MNNKFKGKDFTGGIGIGLKYLSKMGILRLKQTT